MEDKEARLCALGIDVRPTLKRFYGDYDLLVDMLHEFVQEDMAEGMPAACAGGDLGELERIAHALKGTSANLGLVELEGLGEKVDMAVGCYRSVRAGIAAL